MMDNYSKIARDNLDRLYRMVVYPLPKIALCYILYLPDDDFPAAVTCLYSANARLFLPMDALADTGEYTSRKILAIAG
ncbi:MAG: hypothetical protein COX19_11845 [Desulfobacterales bacterium CG23_combo_of_CG06-09_8_20_14_all_51_8]|nr:MAG: hypothetical protein COX19_11845 [Desulfobacterales bacterium CG23_combo_of_CG06-09_8_20_14_all_51_8]